MPPVAETQLPRETADAAGTCYHLPLVSAHDEPVTVGADSTVTIIKSGGNICVRSSMPPVLPENHERIFSLVPGHEALALSYIIDPPKPLTVIMMVS